MEIVACLKNNPPKAGKDMNEIRKIYVIFDQRALKDAGLREGIAKLESLGHSISTKKIEEPGDAARFAGMAVEQKFGCRFIFRRILQY